ncbi:putative e3 ubiquitin-protein ligase hip1 [Nicotiana attenuata]|uniref:RING-type E3 ubiquitin transferase n=1 Tax=Nicotiana attenuata TaxID=49451 RepID=A0A1J6I0H8_NICAT|nr:putative e3 ubiquitin-protein ligase hip1 [Nicotiana attenuata]
MSQDHHQHPYFATRTLPNDVFHLQRMNQQQHDIPHNQTSGISNDTPIMFEYWEITTYCDLDMDIDDSEERAGCFICCCEFQNGDTLVTLPCNDVFHLDCFNERLRRRNDCPFCKIEEEEEKFEVETRTYYSSVMDIDDDEEQETCAICLCEYEDEDTIGKLQCGHEFHVGCVNKWLQQKNACPFCRAEVLPTHD